MNIKQMGDYIEVECCGCNESLLVGSGDMINVRVADDQKEFEGFLCFVCHKNENNSNENFVRVERKKCCSCGKAEEDSKSELYPKFNDSGEFHGFFCEDCF